MQLLLSGSGSVVEHWLPKPGTAGSNPVFRSIIVKQMPEPSVRWDQVFLFISENRAVESLYNFIKLILI